MVHFHKLISWERGKLQFRKDYLTIWNLQKPSTLFPPSKAYFKEFTLGGHYMQKALMSVMGYERCGW